MALAPVTPSFELLVRSEIVLTPKYIVCWTVDEDQCRTIVDIHENYEHLFSLPKDRPVDTGWRGRHIGWTACADAVIVRDDRFSDDPMPVV